MRRRTMPNLPTTPAAYVLLLLLLSLLDVSRVVVASTTLKATTSAAVASSMGTDDYNCIAITNRLECFASIDCTWSRNANGKNSCVRSPDPAPAPYTTAEPTTTNPTTTTMELPYSSPLPTAERLDRNGNGNDNDNGNEGTVVGVDCRDVGLSKQECKDAPECEWTRDGSGARICDFLHRPTERPSPFPTTERPTVTADPSSLSQLLDCRDPAVDYQACRDASECEWVRDESTGEPYCAFSRDVMGGESSEQHNAHYSSLEADNGTAPHPAHTHPPHVHDEVTGTGTGTGNGGERTESCYVHSLNYLDCLAAGPNCEWVFLSPGQTLCQDVTAAIVPSIRNCYVLSEMAQACLAAGGCELVLDGNGNTLCRDEQPGSQAAADGDLGEAEAQVEVGDDDEAVLPSPSPPTAFPTGGIDLAQLQTVSSSPPSQRADCLDPQISKQTCKDSTHCLWDKNSSACSFLPTPSPSSSPTRAPDPTFSPTLTASPTREGYVNCVDPELSVRECVDAPNCQWAYYSLAELASQTGGECLFSNWPPTGRPTTGRPSRDPTLSPTPRPSNEPTLPPTPRPSERPATDPPTTGMPTTGMPTFSPSVTPTFFTFTASSVFDCTDPDMSKEGCKAAVEFCSWDKREEVCLALSVAPTTVPPATEVPTVRPTLRPTTDMPTDGPSSSPAGNGPTVDETIVEDIVDTRAPMMGEPTEAPTANEDIVDTRAPTTNPTTRPTRNPTRRPTKNPTTRPTRNPTRRPTKNPTKNPTRTPTEEPTTSPSYRPSTFPSASPSSHPTITVAPSGQPSMEPTATSSPSISNGPTHSPTVSHYPTMAGYSYERPRPNDLRFLPWRELSRDQQRAAGDELRYTRRTWEAMGTNPVENLRWSDLSTDQRDAAGVLGFEDEAAWNCWMNHWESFSWKQLFTLELTPYLQGLGWDMHSWNAQYGEPPNERRGGWDDLTAGQRRDANMLCYTKTSYDRLDVSEYGLGYPIARPSARFVPWEDIDERLRVRLEQSLGYSALTWNVLRLAPVEQKGWFEFMYYEKDAATALGLDEASWDCWINHYDSYGWSDLTKKGHDVHYAGLGWSEGSWDGTGDAPLSEEKSWSELTEEERYHATELCFGRENWDRIDMTDNVGPFPLPRPALRYTAWDRLSDEQRLSAANVLLYEESTWNDVGSADVEKRAWDDLTEYQKPYAVELGLYQRTWDCFQNHYRATKWGELAEDTSRAAIALGWGASTWSSWSGEPEAYDKEWSRLNEEERSAAHALCHFDATWPGSSKVNLVNRYSGDVPANASRRTTAVSMLSRAVLAIVATVFFT